MADIFERSPETGTYQALLKESLNDLLALDSFSSDGDFTAEGGLASWIGFHTLRTQAEECITRENIKEHVRRANIKLY